MSSARRSTLGHLQRLASVTAVSVAAACGYQTVDPMPQPARCGTADAQFSATGVWQLSGDAGTGLVLVVTITKKTAGAGTLAPDPQPGHNLNLDSMTVDPGTGTATLVFRVPAQTTSASASLPLTCSAGTSTLLVTAAWTATPQAGRIEPVQLSTF